MNKCKGIVIDPLRIMASTLFCKRLVSCHNLCRSLCQATQTGVSWGLVESQTQPRPDVRANDSWTRKVGDLRGDGCDDCFSNEPAPVPDLNVSGSTAEEEYEEDYGEEEYGDVYEPETYVTLMIKRRYAPDCVLVYMHMSNPWPPLADEMNFNLKMLVRHKLKPKIARSFLAQMLIRGTIPDLYSFYLVIDSYCKHLTYQHIHDLFFTQMKTLGVEADTFFYITLMNRVCTCFKPNVGFQLFKKLRSSYGVQTPLSCYDAVVRQFAKMEMMDEEAGLLLIDVLIDMKQQRLFPDEKLYNYLLKVRNSGSDRFLKAIGIGKMMFAESIRTGAVSSRPDENMWKGMEAEETWAFPRRMD